mmetsp:Transcript_41243/g.124708  ORF Transcript_41243/g.124708 Transcript_41243/m.124708 type:complete len:182 (-) Transcript_41243:67-612(-)
MEFPVGMWEVKSYAGPSFRIGTKAREEASGSSSTRAEEDLDLAPNPPPPPPPPPFLVLPFFLAAYNAVVAVADADAIEIDRGDSTTFDGARNAAPPALAAAAAGGGRIVDGENAETTPAPTPTPHGGDDDDDAKKRKTAAGKAMDPSGGGIILPGLFALRPMGLLHVRAQRVPEAYVRRRR